MDRDLEGDRPLPTSGRHGIDIASQRIDELDAACLRFALERERCAAVDLGCGSGFQGLRLALMGCRTLLIDRIDPHPLVSMACGSLPLHHLKADLVQLRPDQMPVGIEIATSQRFLHYLRCDEAVRLLRTLHGGMAPRGRIFLSASGLESELGRWYSGAGEPLHSRFAPLDPEIGLRHQILEPVCLYTEHDLMRILAICGFEVLTCFRSPFGNVKAVGEVSA